jgi:hypothetical protein
MFIVSKVKAAGTLSYPFGAARYARSLPVGRFWHTALVGAVSAPHMLVKFIAKMKR